MTVTWPTLLCNIPNWRSFHSEHKWSLDILWFEHRFPSYFDIYVNLAAILDISAVTWLRLLSNIPNWRSFHSEHKWSLYILWLEHLFPSYLDIYVNLAAILLGKWRISPLGHLWESPTIEIVILLNFLLPVTYDTPFNHEISHGTHTCPRTISLSMIVWCRPTSGIQNGGL